MHHSSIISKISKEYEPFQHESSRSARYEPEHQIHFYASLINNFKNIKKSTNLPSTKALIVHGTNLNTNFLLKGLTISAKFFVSVKDLADRRMHVDPERLLFMFNERILVFLKSDSFYLPSIKTPKMATNPLKKTEIRREMTEIRRFDHSSSVTECD